MATTGGIVLAGGRSSRMGTSKAKLEWHGSTLLRRAVGIVARAVDGPVIVVRSPGQELPDLPPDVEIVEDAHQGRGPLEGLAAGLERSRNLDVAFAASTDAPLLHPALVRHVVAAVVPPFDVAAPVVAGRPHPLAAAYRPSVGHVAAELLSRGDRRLTALLEACTTRLLDEASLLADPALAAADPDLRSLWNANEPAGFSDLRALPAPAVTVAVDGGAGARISVAVHAATLEAALAATAPGLGRPRAATLNGCAVAWDPQLPLVDGDRIRIVVGTPPPRHAGTGGRGAT